MTSTPPNGLNIKQRSGSNHPDKATFVDLFRSPYRSHEAKVQHAGSTPRLRENYFAPQKKHAYHALVTIWFRAFVKLARPHRK